MRADRNWAVVSLVIDNYEGNRNLALETEHPTLTDVTNAINSLNGRSRSSLCICGNDDSVFCVGGGLGSYCVTVTRVDQATLADRAFALYDPTKPADQVNIIVGSVTTPLPANLIVDERTAMTAVEQYFLHGSLAQSLNWIET